MTPLGVLISQLLHIAKKIHPLIDENVQIFSRNNRYRTKKLKVRKNNNLSQRATRKLLFQKYYAIKNNEMCKSK